MAFKPIVKEKVIGGVTYKAQFNGVSAMFDATTQADGDNRKLVDYLLNNVLVEPKIDDMDEYFGTDVDLMNEVIEFASAVMRADKEYFPKPDKKAVKKESN